MWWPTQDDLHGNWNILLKSEITNMPTDTKFISGFFIEGIIKKINKPLHFPIIVSDGEIRSCNKCGKMFMDHITFEDLINFQGCEIEMLRITNQGQPPRLSFLSYHQLNTVMSLCFCTVSEALPWLLWWSTPDHEFLVWHCLIWVDLFSKKLLQIFNSPQFIFQLLCHNEKQIGLTKRCWLW